MSGGQILEIGVFPCKVLLSSSQHDLLDFSDTIRDFPSSLFPTCSRAGGFPRHY